MGRFRLQSSRTRKPDYSARVETRSPVYQSSQRKYVPSKELTWLQRRMLAAFSYAGMVFICVLADSHVADAQVFGLGQQQDIVAMYLFNGQDEATYRKTVETRAMLKVKQIARLVDLDEDGVTKLELAVTGDVSRFFRRIDELQEATKGLDIQNQNDMQKAWELIMPVQEQINSGVLGEDSLFDRILLSVLNDEQEAKYQEYLLARENAKYEAILKMTLVELERSIPLLAKQRTELLKLLMERPRPKKFQEGYLPYVGFIMIARMKDDELSAILDKQQLATVGGLREQYAAYDQLITW